jgi:hypothetical protein
MGLVAAQHAATTTNSTTPTATDPSTSSNTPAESSPTTAQHDSDQGTRSQYASAGLSVDTRGVDVRVDVRVYAGDEGAATPAMSAPTSCAELVMRQSMRVLEHCCGHLPALHGLLLDWYVPRYWLALSMIGQLPCCCCMALTCA